MKRCCSVTGTERNQPKVKRIKKIKADHPYQGNRASWDHLKFVVGMDVNKQLILVLMPIPDLLVKKDNKNNAA